MFYYFIADQRRHMSYLWHLRASLNARYLEIPGNLSENKNRAEIFIREPHLDGHGAHDGPLVSLERLQRHLGDLLLALAQKLLARRQEHLLVLTLDFNLKKNRKRRIMSNHGLEWKKMIFEGNEIEVDDELARQETEKRKWTVAPFPLVFPWQSEFRCVHRFLITAGETSSSAVFLGRDRYEKWSL